MSETKIKFKIFDKVWVIIENQIEQGWIFGIDQRGIDFEKPVEIMYWIGTSIYDRDARWFYEEDQVFVTKQELIDSL